MVRFKNRYLVVEVNPETTVAKFAEFKLSEQALCTAIWGRVQQLYGDFGSAAIANGFVVKYCNAKLRTVLIRVRHGPHRFVTSSLPFVDKISDKKVALNILYMTGTMRNCYKYLIKYHKNRAFQDLVGLKGTPEYDQRLKNFTFVKHFDANL